MAGLWFTGTIGYRPELEVSPFDPERAKELLSDAGYPDGFEFDLYWGAWAATPGELNWLEAAAGYWNDVGITVNIFELMTQNTWPGVALASPVRDPGLRPVSVMTWGRQSHAATLISYGYHREGVYNCCYDDFTEGKWEDLYKPSDKDEQLKIMADIEDYVLENRWVIPMAEDAMAMAIRTESWLTRTLLLQQLLRLALAAGNERLRFKGACATIGHSTMNKAKFLTQERSTGNRR